MINSWFTLSKLRVFLQYNCRGMLIEKAFSYRKNQLVLANADSGGKSIQISFSQPHPNILLKKISEPRRHIRIFDRLQNEIIEDIKISPQDRDLSIQFKSGKRLTIVFRSRSGNAILLNADGILDKFKKNDILPADDEHRNKHDEADLGIKTDPRFNRFWRNNIHEIFGSPQDNAVYDMISRSNGIEWKGRFILKPSEVGESFDPDKFYENYREFIHLSRESKQFEDMHRDLAERLKKRESYLRQSLSRTLDREKVQQRSGKMKFYADCLNSMRGMPVESDKIPVPDMFQQENMPKEIPLDQSKTLQENINSYYDKSSDLRSRMQSDEKRRKELGNELEKLEKALQAFELITTVEEIELFRKKHSAQMDNKINNTEKDEKRPYIEFTSPSGIKVWVGRSARDNDDLTFHYAHKKDIWLHTRHSKGSHVILRSADRKHVDRADLEFAAALAARHSEEKHASLVSVVYTEKKYVSKIRKGGPGLVRYEYEKDILIKPA